MRDTDAAVALTESPVCVPIAACEFLLTGRLYEYLNLDTREAHIETGSISESPERLLKIRSMSHVIENSAQASRRHVESNPGESLSVLAWPV
jgi:hypothetical protein